MQQRRLDEWEPTAQEWREYYEEIVKDEVERHNQHECTPHLCPICVYLKGANQTKPAEPHPLEAKPKSRKKHKR